MWNTVAVNVTINHQGIVDKMPQHVRIRFRTLGSIIVMTMSILSSKSSFAFITSRVFMSRRQICNDGINKCNTGAADYEKSDENKKIAESK